MKLLSVAVPMESWRKHSKPILPEECYPGQRKDSSATQGKAERETQVKAALTLTHW